MSRMKKYQANPDLSLGVVSGKEKKVYKGMYLKPLRGIGIRKNTKTYINGSSKESR